MIIINNILLLVVVWQFLPFKSTLGDRERKKEYRRNSQITWWYNCLEKFKKKKKKMDKIENFLKEPSMKSWRGWEKAR